MKKLLSLVLALLMVLGCMSLTAFATSDPLTTNVLINDVEITAEGTVTNDAIKEGTVTYTVAENNNGIAKLTLNNATINANEQAIETYIESDPTVDLEIELIGTNTVTSEEADAISIDGNCIITGSGSLNANGYSMGIYTDGHLTLGMSGMLTVIGNLYPGINSTNGITVKPGTGKIKVSQLYNDDTPAIVLDNGELTGHKTIIGSADANETDESKMTSVVISEETGWGKISKIEGSGNVAKTVVLTAYPFPESGDTDITLTVAKPLYYDIVIPTDVTNLNNFGVFEVGQAKVENVKNATDKTVISYTAETTAFKCEGKTDIPASYYTDLQGTNTFPTTAVKVYENKKDAENIHTMWVKIAEDAWNAAENGTYTATVTFNFSTKEVTPVTAANALVENAYFKLNFTTTQPYNGTLAWSMTYHKTASGFEATELLENNENVLAYAAKDIQVNANGSIITICMGWENSLTFTLDTSTNIYSFTGDNNEVTFTSFSVKPAGATEFTEISLTKAVPESCTITLVVDDYRFKVNLEDKTSFTVPGGSRIVSVEGRYLTIQTPTGSYFNVQCECPVGFERWSLGSGDEIANNYEIVGDITLIAWCQ